MPGLAILNGITDTRAVLGAAGLSIGDVSDARLMESIPEHDLQLVLYRKLPDYQARLIAAEDSQADLRTQMMAVAIKNYAKWVLAAMLCGRWNYLIQLSTDGKTRQDRFDRMDLSAMQANAEAQRDGAWQAIVDLLPEDERPTVRNPVFFGVSSPSIDPVTDTEA